ncbi:MAG: 3-methyladenine DNA glycosylase AlkD [Psychromonas sp.]|jgi:3-methyladenine DNA glycosylase AlkD|uniref:hypothetical protein n=1 Tax=Psychromonas sp. TaxID=1884585 RepID=UPI0039E4BC0A
MSVYNKGSIAFKRLGRQGKRTKREQTLFKNALKTQLNRLSRVCRTVVLFSAYKKKEKLDESIYTAYDNNLEAHMTGAMKRGWILTELYIASQCSAIYDSLFEAEGRRQKA